LLDQVIGNEFVYLADPEFVDFDIAAKIRLSSGAIESTTIAAAEANLRNFYAASREQFGRGIYRSEIVGILEGTAGVERVVLQDNGAFLEAPVNDTEIAAHELARIVDIDLTVV
jgi:phage-related baseplate assembly protein